MIQHCMLALKLCDFPGAHTIIAKEPYSFAINQGGGGVGGPDPLSPHPSGSANAFNDKKMTILTYEGAKSQCQNLKRKSNHC